MRMSPTAVVAATPEALECCVLEATFSLSAHMEPDSGMLTLARSLACAVAWLAIAQTAVAQETPRPRGRLLFLRCASCHDITLGLSPKIGPSLAGVIGRRAGSLEGYAYSPAMKAQTFTWNDLTLDAWLTRPTALVPGTAMAFGGLESAADRKAIIDYLRAPNR